ncbi:MAG: hypothetical protein WC867_04170 [Candidatus Pacearchaeota archaeon]|jgi:hypothetical protein
MKHKFRLLIGLLMIIFLIMFVIAQSDELGAVGVFNKDDVESWASSADNIKEFEKLSNKDKNAAWTKASDEQREKFVNGYSNSKGYKLEFKGFGHKDLTWNGNSLVSINGEKRASFYFDSVRESLKSVSYDEATKTISYSYEKGEVKNKITLDNGFVDKDGMHTLQDVGIFKTTNTPLAQVIRGNGDIEYKDGQYTISKDAKNRGIMIGNNYYSKNEEGIETIIKPDLELGANRVFNAKISMLENHEVTKPSAIVKTSSGKNEDGSPKFVAFFDSKEAPEDFKEPYTYVNLNEKKIVIDDKNEITKSNRFMQVEIFKDFNSVVGNGAQSWIKNGNAQLSFPNGKLMFADGVRRGSYEIDLVKNINSPDSAKTTFTFKKTGNNGYVGFYDMEDTLYESGALISETSGMFVYGPRGRQLGGASETAYSNIKYDEKYRKGVFKGTEEERLEAIMRDPNTVLIVHGTSSISLPGQYVATELLSNLEYETAISELKLQESGSGVKSGKTQLSGLIIASALSTKEPLVSIQDPKIRSTVVDRLVTLKFAKTKAEAETLIDGYIISENYDSSKKMSGLNSEEVAKLPPVNRLLYELSVNNEGNVNIPERASLRARPSSSGGIDKLEFAADGVYVDGKKIPGVTPQVASALRNTASNKVINFEKSVVERKESLKKYTPQQIREAGYPFDTSQFPTQRHTSEIYTSRIIGARQVGQMALDSGRAKLSGKESQYSYYQTNKKLP